MTEIEKHLKLNEDKMRLGACIQFENYLEMFDMFMDVFKTKIEENSPLFDNDILVGDWLAELDRLHGQITFFTMSIQKDLENKKFNSCDYFIKYNN